MKNSIAILCLLIFSVACTKKTKEKEKLEVRIFQTSEKGDSFNEIEMNAFEGEEFDTLELIPSNQFQTITGFGGAFTESSAHLLQKMSVEKREEVIKAYFSEEGANYSLTRTHINSCDFSLDHYSYSPVENDTNLENFSIEPDRADVIPMIKQAKEVSKDGFKIVASPWTAPPWMKNNNDWYGGKLKKEFYPTWANFFTKYIAAYKNEGIDIWGITIENEPLGNDSHWESMHYTPKEMGNFVKNHLGPQFEKAGLNQKILVYDQNRGEELKEWADVLLKDKALEKYIYGTAIHWYTSTNDVMAESIEYTHNLAPEKSIIHTEGCIDSEVPHWKEDKWYWKKEATDWGYEWAPEKDKPKHPKYVPVYRYARDIIGCMNNWVEGWIDWNMVLDKQGGPNLAQNWCIAPILVDTTSDEIYYTPLYYTMMHFSKFIRPGAKRIELKITNKDLLSTAVENKDGSIVMVVLNMETTAKQLVVNINNQEKKIKVAAQGLQTIVIEAKNIRQ